MNFIEELSWRGMLHDMTPEAEAELTNQMTTGYIGFDPTAPSLTIGNYVQIMLLDFFQRSGHRPIFLLGGATGRIGDPSGKDQERTLLGSDQIEQNLEFQKQQAKKFLNFEHGDNKALMINNYDFYKNMNVLDYLRDVGKNITVNYMLSKESVKKRLESGISYTEFSYQVLQAYDFLYLFQNYHCKFQMGGSDQWGNITSGTEFIRKNTGKKAFAITTPLLTKADGSKFGKSEGGNIWLDPNLTSPYKFYQFWINAADADLNKYFRYFSFKSKEEIEALENQFADDPRILKKLLAEEITTRVHSREDLEAVTKVTSLLFGRNQTEDQLHGLSNNALEMMSGEIPSFSVPDDCIKNGISISELMVEQTSILQSKGDARRAIKNNAISVNKKKIQSHEFIINHEHLLQGKFIMIENGKKNKFIIKII